MVSGFNSVVNSSFGGISGVSDGGFVFFSFFVFSSFKLGLGSELDSDGEFVEDILEDGFSSGNVGKFSDSSDVFSSAVVVFFSLHSSEVGELDFGFSSKFFSSDELLVGLVELDGKVDKVGLE